MNAYWIFSNPLRRLTPAWRDSSTHCWKVKVFATFLNDSDRTFIGSIIHGTDEHGVPWFHTLPSRREYDALIKEAHVALYNICRCFTGAQHFYKERRRAELFSIPVDDYLQWTRSILR